MVTRSASVVVVGGGCVGASTAYHLTRLGVPDVLLLEADQLASGSTSKAAGGIRVQYSDELNTRIALRSLREFEMFEELTGAKIDLKQNGYLFLLESAADIADFGSAVQLQRSLGVPTVELSPAEVAERVPALDLSGVELGVWSPWDGVATPEAVVHGYAAAARRAGARLVTCRPVVELLAVGGRIRGVRTAEGVHVADAVVIAAGVGSAAVGATVGLSLPVTGLRRWIHFTDADCGVTVDSPLVVDFTSSFYFHRERNGLVFGGRESTLEAMSEAATRRLPALADAPITSSWSGLYDMSPDHNAMIGAAPVDGLYYATGFSGHGFMQSPAVGEYLAELVTGATPTLDLSALSAERFAAGVPRAERFVI